jgi:selenocysteine-specific elongation factor
MAAHVVTTAGHVDHGKSTLVQALTGTDPDRLAEEKERGLTIDLGFAWTVLPSGREMAFVDVPGHERLIKNMLAGAGAVERCLFVVAATEGWKAQSEEHLRILDLLGYRDGVLALTKVAGMDRELVELARLEVAERVGGTFLEGRPIVAVDAPAGLGVDELRRALDDLCAGPAGAAGSQRSAAGRVRLWVDRSFTVRGSGTVVTGMLAGGPVRLGDRLQVLPGPPPDFRPLDVRVRGLQAQGRTVGEARPGRVAVNLTGVAAAAVLRGCALVAPSEWEPARVVDVSLAVLPGLGHDVSRRGAYRAHFGSGQHEVGLRLLEVGTLAPGEAGCARLHLPVALALKPGDRFVLREVGRSETVGGGEVLDVAPVLPASRARPDGSVDRVVRERGFVDASLLERLTGVRRPPDLAGRWVCDPGARAVAAAALLAQVERAGQFGLDMSTLDELHRALVGTLPGIVVEAGRARGASAAAAAGEPLAAHPYLAALEASPYQPPDPGAGGVDRRELRELVRQGKVVESGGCYFARSAVESAAAAVAAMLAEEPSGVTVSAVRERLGTSRKYVLPLLAHLDASGVTRRRGDVRVGGPRLPPAAQVPQRRPPQPPPDEQNQPHRPRCQVPRCG